MRRHRNLAASNPNAFFTTRRELLKACSQVQRSSIPGTSYVLSVKFHLALRPSSTAFQISDVTGHFMTSAEYSSMMASQISMACATVCKLPCGYSEPILKRLVTVSRSQVANGNSKLETWFQCFPPKCVVLLCSWRNSGKNFTKCCWVHS